mgnify:FL=1
MNAIPKPRYAYKHLAYYARCIKAGLHGRTTKGRIYKCYVNDERTKYIGQDDKGKLMWLCIENTSYYAPATETEYVEQHFPTPGNRVEYEPNWRQIDDETAAMQYVLAGNKEASYTVIDRSHTATEERQPMKAPKIKKTYLVDNELVDAIPTDKLLEHIRNNLREIDNLKSLDIDSTYVTKQIEQREKAGAKLVKLLDARTD